MEEEASLLEQVKRKELELKEQEENARVQAQAIISDAKQRSSEMIEGARKEGESRARERYSQGMAELESEMQALRSEAEARRLETARRGESRVADAAPRIVEKVAFE
jgi:vacuolar-type H+-ATPase subunit H